MTNVFNRLGNLGVALIAAALLVGGLAGATVAHHYDTLSTKPAASHQHGSNKAQQSDQGEKENSKSTKPSKPKPKPKASPKVSPETN